ncbi:hypothetical protein JXB41_08770 [Candidatus Woesearchaeota archaeon]|nr:hypothetical protein [Candidatus Woesearchaeota archaeon]
MIVIFTLIFIAFLGFLVMINSTITDITEEEDYAAMRNFAENIKNEVILATQVHDNYLRRFHVPADLNGKEYNAYLRGDILDIELKESYEITKTYTTALPVEVKGGFIEDKTQNLTDHCITKNNFDGVRIARNQVSLELYDLNGLPIQSEEEFTSLSKGKTFYVYARMSCVEDIRGVQFTISFDENKIKHIGHSVIDRTTGEENPLFGEIIGSGNKPEGLDFSNFKPPVTAIAYMDPENSAEDNAEPYPLFYMSGELAYPEKGDDLARITIGFIARDCGTGVGNIAKIKFQVKSDAEEGNTLIQFDPEFNPDLYSLINPEIPDQVLLEDNLLVYDCKTLEKNIEALPDTKVNAKLRII